MGSPGCTLPGEMNKELREMILYERNPFHLARSSVSHKRVLITGVVTVLTHLNSGHSHIQLFNISYQVIYHNLLNTIITSLPR